ncbi:hypothetical protein MTR67_037765 [Solanum verrucosum]|uniref:Uncharacterized protein n=1 Tax=Solanum verrucosum TaxID=315347 RepID=A0AAF0UE28_SOLVR|nr:hypothetical protein MTR67_037765 [Solanum verrucosum]
MSDVVEQLKVIQAEFSDISRTVTFETVCDVRVVFSCVLSRTNAPTFNNDVVVGFTDVVDNVIDVAEVLKLLSRAFEDVQWDMKDGEFLKLKFLKTLNNGTSHLIAYLPLSILFCKVVRNLRSSLHA